MENSIYIALSRQVALRRAMDATAHNVANMSTPGFRAAHPLFREALTATGPGEASSFVSQAGDYKDMRTGALRRTGSPLHAAVVGPGFFAARAPSGQVAYTKAGEFQRGPDGALLTAGGASVLSQGGGAITLPAGAQSVSI
ncbi:MAG TPA: flagellar basal-body rod protein FlgF, partial [Rhodospirillaceae bacterium]|nr:flagellar basal-body rod protein FlgF [Rhodospirillaceae bacterium]